MSYATEVVRQLVKTSARNEQGSVATPIVGGRTGAHLGRNRALSHEKRSAYDLGKVAALQKLGFNHAASILAASQRRLP
jgi:hypothetical protein